MTADILSKIADYKRLEVADRRARVTLADLDKRMAEVCPPRGFERALRAQQRPGRLALIAEIKKASPSKGLIRADFDPPALALAYERAGAACLSILTDGPSFQGDDTYLTAARAAVGLPCLRKEFLVDPWQVAESRALGADAILVILSMVDDSVALDLLREAGRLGMDALVETHDESEFARAQALGARMIGINNRNLRTFETDLAVTEQLIRNAPPSALIITESGIFTPADVARLAQAGAGAMLVGESLMRQADVETATRGLLRA
jgi:indole-3-glycerol phosphate synthase